MLPSVPPQLVGSAPDIVGFGFGLTVTSTTSVDEQPFNVAVTV